jgi:hypothetical protein
MGSIMKKLILAAAILASTGCASIVSDSSYPVTLSGDGVGYKIKKESGLVMASGTTPNTVSLKAGDGYFSGATYTIAFKSPCRQQNVILDSQMDGWYLGNLLFGGLIGFLIIDPATGAMFKLDEHVNSPISNDCE